LEGTRTVVTLMAKVGHLSPTLMERLEDKALELAEQFDPDELRRVVLALALQQRRCVPLLRALSYHLLQKPAELPLPVLTDLLFAYSKLSFQQPQGLHRLSLELQPHLGTLSPAQVSRCARSFASLRWLSRPLAEAIAQYSLDNAQKLSITQLCGILVSFARLNFQPSSSEEFFSMVTSLESWNSRAVWVGRDLRDPPQLQIPSPKPPEFPVFPCPGVPNPSQLPLLAPGEAPEAPPGDPPAAVTCLRAQVFPWHIPLGKGLWDGWIHGARGHRITREGPYRLPWGTVGTPGDTCTPGATWGHSCVPWVSPERVPTCPTGDTSPRAQSSWLKLLHINATARLEAPGYQGPFLPPEVLGGDGDRDKDKEREKATPLQRGLREAQPGGGGAPPALSPSCHPPAPGIPRYSELCYLPVTFLGHPPGTHCPVTFPCHPPAHPSPVTHPVTSLALSHPCHPHHPLAAQSNSVPVPQCRGPANGRVLCVSLSPPVGPGQTDPHGHVPFPGCAQESPWVALSPRVPSVPADAEAVLDSDNKPLPVRDFTAPHLPCSEGTKPLPPGARRVAVLRWEFPQFSSRGRELLGRGSMARRHLRAAGFLLAEVPHYEFLELKLERQRVAYLKDKVAKALASDTAGDMATDTAT
ncbi:PREDICTED: protein TBRG4, partial [Corvus brachyrhynchos]|uniref:protein TBRG4 n=1 Tax=Corvus brachyrhynchos TaxID=85066 RepID=UPI000816509D